MVWIKWFNKTKNFAGKKLIFTFVPPFKNGAIAQLVEQRTENPCVPGSIPGGTTKKAPRICERLFFCHPSSFRPCFEDGTLIFCHPSSYKPVFEDGTEIFRLPSSYKPVFEDRHSVFADGGTPQLKMAHQTPSVAQLCGSVAHQTPSVAQSNSI